MFESHALTTFLWITPIVVEVLIAGAMLIRRLHRELPCFTAYVLFDAVENIVLWLVRRDLHVYIPAYWVGEAIGAALQFLVIYEIYHSVLANYPAVQKLGNLLFRWSATVLACFAILSAVSSPGDRDPQFASAVLTLERSVRIVQCGLLLFLFSFASFLRLNWKHYIFGIAAGFVLSATAELAIVALRAHGGPDMRAAFALLKPASFNCAVMIWGAYILQPHRVLQPLQRIPNFKLSEWDRALSELLAS
jgi:hypothetical protein